MTQAPLDNLDAPLDRKLLHVFVAGPGHGEGIAVALPDAGWLVLDGCRVSTARLPLLAILEKWRGANEPVDALLLTHPHTDHAYGVRDVLELTTPRAIGLATDPTDPGIAFAALDVQLHAIGGHAIDQVARRTVVDAMLALRRRFVAAPGDLIALVDSARLPLTTSRAAAYVRAPDEAVVRSRLRSGLRGDPNELSAVIELVFGATRVGARSWLATRTSGATSRSRFRTTARLPRSTRA